MTTLAPRWRPLWPLLKRGHRFLSLVLGFVYRAVSPLLGARGLPTGAYLTSAEAARAEPEQVVRTAAGPAYRMTRDVPVGDPPRHPVFVAGQHIEIAERHVLEIEQGRLVGDYGALVTPGGRLVYEASTYFGIGGWREHPVFLRPTVGPARHLPGRVLSLVSRGTATNYYHFLYHAIARLEVLEASGVAQDFDSVVVPHETRYQRELLDLVGVTSPLVRLGRGESLSADLLVVPSASTDVAIVSRETVEWLRRRLLPDTPSTASERIYITRSGDNVVRRYLQEELLWPELQARGFIRVDPGTLSVREQIALFSRAEIVVSPHGAGLTNITFAPAGAQILEFFAPSYVHLGLWSIAEAHGHLRYRYLVGDAPNRRSRLPQPMADISLEPRRILDVVDSMILEMTDARP